MSGLCPLERVRRRQAQFCLCAAYARLRAADEKMREIAEEALFARDESIRELSRLEHDEARLAGGGGGES